ncbi:hypothetical protein U1Q18_015022, partial [Sarracenia purpurea var. burkii]
MPPLPAGLLRRPALPCVFSSNRRSAPRSTRRKTRKSTVPVISRTNPALIAAARCLAACSSETAAIHSVRIPSPSLKDFNAVALLRKDSSEISGDRCFLRSTSRLPPRRSSPAPATSQGAVPVILLQGRLCEIPNLLAKNQ